MIGNGLRSTNGVCIYTTSLFIFMSTNHDDNVFRNSLKNGRVKKDFLGVGGTVRVAKRAST
jgi:hypothetical protein